MDGAVLISTLLSQHYRVAAALQLLLREPIGCKDILWPPSPGVYDTLISLLSVHFGRVLRERTNTISFRSTAELMKSHHKFVRLNHALNDLHIPSDVLQRHSVHLKKTKVGERRLNRPGMHQIWCYLQQEMMSARRISATASSSSNVAPTENSTMYAIWWLWVATAGNQLALVWNTIMDMDHKALKSITFPAQPREFILFSPSSAQTVFQQLDTHNQKQLTKIAVALENATNVLGVQPTMPSSPAVVDLLCDFYLFIAWASECYDDLGM